MTHKMPGKFNRPKSRKRKGSSEVKNTIKASTRRSMTNPKTPLTEESSTAVNGHTEADGLETVSTSYKCQQAADRRKSSASPELDELEGKENERKMGLDLESCRVIDATGKQEPGDMECEETDKNMFPDDDSNQILPVEQFFGNLEVVQDFPQRPSVTSGCFQRERRRRHYYAREDSNDEEAGLGSTQGD